MRLQPVFLLLLFSFLVTQGCREESSQQADVAGNVQATPSPSPSPNTPVPVTATEEEGLLQVSAGELLLEFKLESGDFRIMDTVTGKELLRSVEQEGPGPWYRYGLGSVEEWILNLYTGFYFPFQQSVDWSGAGGILSWQLLDGEIRLELASGNGTLQMILSDFCLRRFSLKVRGKSDTNINRIGMAFEAGQDEGFHGFGERFNAVNQRGKTLHCWTEEGSFSLGNYGSVENLYRFPGGTTSTYFPVPFLVSSRGYGLELDTTRRSTFDLADERPDAFRFDVEHNEFGATFFFGTTPAQTLEMYTEKQGRSLIPPMWAFGPWNQLSAQINGKSGLEMANIYVEEDIPSSVRQGYIHFFPHGSELGIEQILAAENEEYHALGLKSTCYFNSYVGKNHPTLFEEATQAGFLVKKPGTGKPYLFAYMNYLAGEVDFTNPDATAWFQSQLKRAVDMGFDGWMYDFGEYTTVDSVFFDGRDGFAVHNEYPVLYQKALFDFLKQYDPDPDDDYAPDFIPYVRSGYSGSARYTWAHWTGDPSSDWSFSDGLPAQIPASLSIGLSGVPYSGSDIGGFAWYIQPPPSEELWIRWTQVGCFSGLMRDQTGGLGTGEKTQIFDFPEAKRVWRKYAKLRTALFPYIYTLAHEARETGLPIMRHHLLHFPGDETARAQEYQYMFGDRLLAAPVILEGATTQEVYLPEGETWIDAATATRYDEEDGRFRIAWSPIQTGGQTVTVSAPRDRMPLFVRAGSIIPTLDPEVDTLNEATDPRVTPYAQRAHLLHLWIWPDGNGEATGKTWDGGSFHLSNSLLTIEGKAGSTIIAQVALGPGTNNPMAQAAGSGQNLPTAAGWKELVEGISPMQFWDSTLGTLWLRLPPGNHQVILP